MLSGSMAVLFEVFFPVPEALEHPHARQAVISIIDKIFFITKSPSFFDWQIIVSLFPLVKAKVEQIR